jgi:hypothetical protein
MQALPLIDLDILFSDFGQLERLGVVYGYGAKAPQTYKGKLIKLSEVTPAIIKQVTGSIDCSGYFRWGIARATKGALVLKDGSQNQREQFEEWAQEGLIRKVDYRQAAQYITQKRFFANFIRPGYHGCGPVGHVFGSAQYDDGNNGTKCGTLESHGGGGCISRPWNYPVLLREVYNSFELPTVQGAK